MRAAAWSWVLCWLVVAAVPAAAAPAVRALVIGINAYESLPDLEGAVGDARDVARALSSIGVRDLVVLEDAAATRARIVAQWRSLMARAVPGDTLVLSYAGHGGQEPERVRGSERDGRDEVLLLGGFAEQGAGTRERIFDDELNGWFMAAGAKGFQVIFVADACHSGTLTRALDPRVVAPVYRTASYTIADDLLAAWVPEVPVDEGDLTHVSFLAAGQEHERIPELELPGSQGRPEPRGALSYMFARAVEGQADLDGDGVLRRDELWRFVRENVRMLSAARQTPNLLPNSRGGEPVLRLTPPPLPSITAAEPVLDNDISAPTPLVPPPAPDGDAVEAVDSPEPFVAVEPVEHRQGPRLAVLHAGAGDLAAVRDTLPGVQLVSVEESPDLVWDAQTFQVITGLGDVAAHGVDLRDLPAAVGKWQAVDTIRQLSARASLRLRVYPHDGTHRRGTRIEVEITGLRHPRLTLLGLSGNGVVHYLYPRPGDPQRVTPERPLRLPLEVTEPFGADHVVALSAAESLDRLNAALHRLDGQPAARQVADLLAAAAAGTADWWSGIQGLFTAP